MNTSFYDRVQASLAEDEKATEEAKATFMKIVDIHVKPAVYSKTLKGWRVGLTHRHGLTDEEAFNVVKAFCTISNKNDPPESTHRLVARLMPEEPGHALVSFERHCVKLYPSSDPEAPRVAYMPSSTATAAPNHRYIPSMTGFAVARPPSSVMPTMTGSVTLPSTATDRFCLPIPPKIGDTYWVCESKTVCEMTGCHRDTCFIKEWTL